MTYKATIRCLCGANVFGVTTENQKTCKCGTVLSLVWDGDSLTPWAHIEEDEIPDSMPYKTPEIEAYMEWAKK